LNKSNRFRNALRIALGILAIALIAGGSALFYFLESSVVVYNEAPVALTNVRVTLANQTVWTGSLAAGEKRKVYGRPDTDGTVGLSFEASGHVVRREFGYVTPGLAERHRLVILPSFDVKYSTG
jgi:hypothetical protein